MSLPTDQKFTRLAISQQANIKKLTSQQVVTKSLTLTQGKPGDILAQGPGGVITPIPRSELDNSLQNTKIYEASKSATCSVFVSDGFWSWMGSGWVYAVDAEEKRAYIVTCAHVVLSVYNTTPLEEATEFAVTIGGANNNPAINVQVAAEIVGYDASADVALLRTLNTSESPDFGFDFTSAQKILEFANSDETAPGRTVQIIGNPFGEDFVSCAVGNCRDNKFVPVNQLNSTEAFTSTTSVAGGNSGSPVLNTDGKVVGILSWGLSVVVVGGCNSYMMEQIVNKIRTLNTNFVGSTGKGFLGINFGTLVAGHELEYLRSVYPAFAASGLDEPNGFSVWSLATDSITIPGSRIVNGSVPLEPDDIILSVTSTVAPLETVDIGVFTDQASWTRITHFRAGQKVVLTCVRPSTATTFTSNVILDEFPVDLDYVFTPASSHMLQPKRIPKNKRQ